MDPAVELAARWLPAGPRLGLALVLGLAAARPDSAQAAPAERRPSLAEAGARIQALLQGPTNSLAPFRPGVAGTEDPWSTPRAVPLVHVSSPWGTGEGLWIQVPEHAWTTFPGESTLTLLFSGRPPEIASSHGWSVPHRPLAPPEWRPRADGGIQLDSALEGGLAVHFAVLPVDRGFEIRFGVTNGTPAPLGPTAVQLCSGFEKMGALSDQGPEGGRMWSGGKAVGWQATGDLGWIEAWRDPLTCRIEKSCFFKAYVRGHEPVRAAAPSAALRLLDRPLDLPVLLKSDPDGRRHVALYSPCAREVMYNALTPCGHADPVVDGIAPGETHWGVLYGLFFEGEADALLAALAALDGELRTTAGFRE
jgi:hypothetical protein